MNEFHNNVPPPPLSTKTTGVLCTKTNFPVQRFPHTQIHIMCTILYCVWLRKISDIKTPSSSVVCVVRTPDAAGAATVRRLLSWHGCSDKRGSCHPEGRFKYVFIWQIRALLPFKTTALKVLLMEMWWENMLEHSRVLSSLYVFSICVYLWDRDRIVFT